MRILDLGSPPCNDLKERVGITEYWSIEKMLHRQGVPCQAFSFFACPESGR